MVRPDLAACCRGIKIPRPRHRKLTDRHARRHAARCLQDPREILRVSADVSTSPNIRIIGLADRGDGRPLLEGPQTVHQLSVPQAKLPAERRTGAGEEGCRGGELQRHDDEHRDVQGGGAGGWDGLFEVAACGGDGWCAWDEEVGGQEGGE